MKSALRALRIGRVLLRYRLDDLLDGTPAERWLRLMRPFVPRAAEPSVAHMPRGARLRLALQSTGHDRLIVQETTQIVGQLAGTGITAFGSFMQTFETDCLQINRYARLQLARRDWILIHDQEQSVHGRLGSKGRSTGEHFVQRNAEAIDIAAWPGCQR